MTSIIAVSHSSGIRLVTSVVSEPLVVPVPKSTLEYSTAKVEWANSFTILAPSRRTGQDTGDSQHAHPDADLAITSVSGSVQTSVNFFGRRTVCLILFQNYQERV